MTGADELAEIVRDGEEFVRAAADGDPVSSGIVISGLHNYIAGTVVMRAAALFQQHNYGVGVDLVMLAAQMLAQLCARSLDDPLMVEQVMRIRERLRSDAENNNLERLGRLTDAELEELLHSDDPTSDDGKGTNT